MALPLMALFSWRMALVLVIFLFQCVQPGGTSLNIGDATIACSVSSCMGWCGCQTKHDFTDIVSLRSKCQQHFHHLNESYTSHVRCTEQLCLCKNYNENCKRCQRDADNDILCFRQSPPSREVSACKGGVCYALSTACGAGTGCYGCMRPSTTSRPSTRGPAFPPPPRRPQSPAPQQPSNGAGGWSNPSSTPVSGPSRDGARGNGGFNPDQESNNHVLPHEDDTENKTAKIAAIVACTIMILISCTVLAIVICKFRKHAGGRDQHQNGDLKEADGCNGYATIGEPNRANGSCPSREKLFSNQMYDGAFIINSNNSSGPPIPLSERHAASRQASAEPYSVTSPGHHPPTAQDHDTSSDIRSDSEPLVSQGQCSPKVGMLEYMSLKKIEKPLPPWKGPHGERYNLEGYTELNMAVPNKSNNASPSSPQRTASECLLASSHMGSEVGNLSRSLPTTTTRFPFCSESEYHEYSKVSREDPLQKESDYYYKLEGDQPVSDGDDTLDRGVESPYYYKLEPDGEAVVTLIANPCCVRLDDMAPENNEVEDAVIPSGMSASGMLQNDSVTDLHGMTMTCQDLETNSECCERDDGQCDTHL